MLMTRAYQKARFEQTAEDLRDKIDEAGAVRGGAGAVEIVVTDQGLRIELMETGEGETFFDKASASLKPSLVSVLEVIAQDLQTLPNEVVVEGHTDALPFGSSGYSNWELSVDRANSARRVLIASGLEAHRVAEVRGYADRHPKNPENTLDPRNRRISVLLPFREEPEVQEFQPTGSSILGEAPLPEDFLPVPEADR
jgi:chemotaxis protein MotB